MSTKVYFLGGTSPQGFKSKFIEQIKKSGYYTYILKGGPGTGKSTLMKKIAKEFEDSPVSVYYCSSDINSLDAVVIEDRKIIVVDGTAPHVFEALYPAVSQEIINLGEYWDKSKMKGKEEAVRECFDENQKYHNRVRCYVEAFSSLNTDIYNLAENCLDKAKLDSYIKRLARKVIPKSKTDKQGKKEFKQLSAFTTENYMTLKSDNNYSRYFINDDYFAGSDYLLRSLSDMFTDAGYDVTVSECNMLHNSIYEHIVIEELKLMFTTGNFFNKLKNELDKLMLYKINDKIINRNDIDLLTVENIDDSIYDLVNCILKNDNENVINFMRFYHKDKLSAKKQRISFDKKASLELAEEAAESLETALKIHDELEKYYINAIDFDRLNDMSENFIKMLKTLPEV